MPPKVRHDLARKKKVPYKASSEQRINLESDPGLKSPSLSQTFSAQSILMKILPHPHYYKVQLCC